MADHLRLEEGGAWGASLWLLGRAVHCGRPCVVPMQQVGHASLDTFDPTVHLIPFDIDFNVFDGPGFNSDTFNTTVQTHGSGTAAQSTD